MTTMQETVICPECGKELDQAGYGMECDRCLSKKEEE